MTCLPWPTLYVTLRALPRDLLRHIRPMTRPVESVAVISGS